MEPVCCLAWDTLSYLFQGCRLHLVGMRNDSTLWGTRKGTPSGVKLSPHISWQSQKPELKKATCVGDEESKSHCHPYTEGRTEESIPFILECTSTQFGGNASRWIRRQRSSSRRDRHVHQVWRPVSQRQ